MLTRWGRGVDPDHPWPEHPRPQLVRPGWATLNGRWEHAFTATPQRPDVWAGPVVVPFSPESVLSGVGRQLLPHEWLWYRRSFRPPPVPDGGRLLLHFGAVDQVATVWVDGREVGSHTGGYLPFTLDVTDALEPADVHAVEVRVQDLSETGVHARGKQRLDRGTIWYTAQSGIWQTVWLEAVPALHVARLALVPRPDESALEVTVHASAHPDPDGPAVAAEVEVRSGERVVGTARVRPGVPTVVPLASVRLWSPEDPHLHDVVVRLGEDRVDSYVGLRTFGVGTDRAGHRRLLLNGAPYPHVGVLDQGYWPDGLLTPPSDAAVVEDLSTMRDLGFTVLRKHVKIEPLRWYHHCDRLGLIVWQDVVNGGGRYRPLVVERPARRHGRVAPRLPDHLHRVFGRSDAAGREEFRREVRATVELLGNVASIAVWTPFNEGWGQFDAAAVADEVAWLDPTRLVCATSGWVDQGAGDLRTFHVYGRRFSTPRPRRGDDRVLALDEYGGHSLRVPGHDASRRAFGYVRHADAASLAAAFTGMHEQLVHEVGRGLAATVYTQLSDVEDELNGLLTWDREVLKIDAAVVRRATAALRRAMTPP